MYRYRELMNKLYVCAGELRGVIQAHQTTFPILQDSETVRQIDSRLEAIRDDMNELFDAEQEDSR